MDFDRLAEFITIARWGSIKKAALELGISSATLSARLIRFEEHLGTPLFFRTADAMVLTAAGSQLLPSAQEIVRSYQNIHSSMRSVQDHSYHQLRIAISDSNLPLNLGPFLDQLNLNYPNIRLEIMDDSRYGIIDGLQSGAVDIYFAPVMADFAPKDLAKVPVSTLAQYVILPRKHPLADCPMVSIRELDGECFILYPRTAEPASREFQIRNLEDSGIRYSVSAVALHQLIGQTIIVPHAEELFGPYAQNWIRAEKAAKGQVSIIKVDNLSTALFLVSMGKGICIAPRYVKNMLSPETFIVSISDHNCRFDEYLYYNENGNGAAELFFEEFTRAVEC